MKTKIKNEKYSMKSSNKSKKNKNKFKKNSRKNNNRKIRQTKKIHKMNGGGYLLNLFKKNQDKSKLVKQLKIETTRQGYSLISDIVGGNIEKIKGDLQTQENENKKQKQKQTDKQLKESSELLLKNLQNNFDPNTKPNPKPYFFLPKEYHLLIQGDPNLTKEFKFIYEFEDTTDEKIKEYAYIRVTTPEQYIDKAQPFEEITLLESEDILIDKEGYNLDKKYERNDYKTLDKKYRAMLLATNLANNMFLKKWKTRTIQELKKYINDDSNDIKYLYEDEYNLLDHEYKEKLEKFNNSNNNVTYKKKENESSKLETASLKKELLEKIEKGEIPDGAELETKYHSLVISDKELQKIFKIENNYGNITITKKLSEAEIQAQEQAKNENKKEEEKKRSELLEKIKTMPEGTVISISEYNLLSDLPEKQKQFTQKIPEIQIDPSIVEPVKYVKLASPEENAQKYAKQKEEVQIEIEKLLNSDYIDKMMYETYYNLATPEQKAQIDRLFELNADETGYKRKEKEKE